MSISPTINSPKSTNSPKEKRFTFFSRSRTISGSSNESTGPSSPRLSPRTLFEKVTRKRSQNEKSTSTSSLKMPPPFAPPPPSKVMQPLPVIQVNNDNVKAAAQASRKRLSHSISEENDVQLNDEANNNHLDLNYQTFHGATQSFKQKLLNSNDSCLNNLKLHQLFLDRNTKNKVSS